MPPVEHVVIAAAGFGSRLGRGHPKCLVEFRGKTLLERQLDLLKDVPDVRIVVGFQEDLVIERARALRDDITFVRNRAYASTTTLSSYELGARYIDAPCVFMDADIVFDPASFSDFLDAASTQGAPLVAYTDAKTVDAVHCTVESGKILSFSRTTVTAYEWANLACLPPRYCEGSADSVYGHLSRDLPLQGHYVVSHEIDRPEDYEAALRYAPLAEAIDQQAGAARAAVTASHDASKHAEFPTQRAR